MQTLFTVLAAVGFGGCVDEANSIAGPGQTRPADRLSEMGIFVGPLAELQPRADLVPYDVNVTLYSDSAKKQRFLWVPPGTTISANEDRWDVPLGAYFVKNFFYPNDERDPAAGIHVVETRFLVKQATGLVAATYVWNDDQSDAVASAGNVDVPVRWIDATGALHDEPFHVPGTSLCQSCHADRTLGIRTRQIVHSGTYPDGTNEQATHLLVAGVLDTTPPPGLVLVDPLGTAPLDERARSYLDANCAHCHASVADASGTQLYWDYEDTDAAHLAACRRTSAVGGNEYVIEPGNPDRSEFLSRMLSADPFVRMPRGPSRIPDGTGIAMLSSWIEAMTPTDCP